MQGGFEHFYQKRAKNFTLTQRRNKLTKKYFSQTPISSTSRYDKMRDGYKVPRKQLVELISKNSVKSCWGEKCLNIRYFPKNIFILKMSDLWGANTHVSFWQI